MGLLDVFTKASGPGARAIEPRPAQAKAAFDLLPHGVQGRALAPDSSGAALLTAYKRNELVFACINAKAQAAVDPRFVVQERRGSGNWAESIGHPLRRLIMRPNPYMTESDLMRAAISSLDVSGRFYAEIVRGKGSRLPVQLWPLNPNNVARINGPGGTVAGYQYKIGRAEVFIKAEDMIERVALDFTTRLGALSPLAVALGAVDADTAQTDFIRSFFNNAGVPSGFLKILNRSLDEGEAQDIKAQWRSKYGRSSGLQNDIAVLDENAEYQKVGAGLDELDSDSIRGFTESRICMVFGVPPQIVGAKVGLEHATYSNYQEAMRAFWDNTLGPLFKDWASFFTWALLPQFEGERVDAEQVRCSWDMSEVAALQEDVDQAQARSRAAFQVGGITLNELRSDLKRKKDPAGEYYLRPLNVEPVMLGEAIGEQAQQAREQSAQAPEIEPAPGDTRLLTEADLLEGKSAQLPEAKKKDLRAQILKQRRALDKLEAKARADVESYLSAEYKAAAQQLAKRTKAGEPEQLGLALDFGDRIAKTLGRWYVLILQSAYDDSKANTGFELDFDLANDAVQGILAELAQKVRAVADTTRQEIQALVGKQAAEGWTIEQLAAQIGELAFARAKTRAELIATTESAAAYSLGSANYYREAGVKRAEWLVFDPCPICEPNADTQVKLGSPFPSGHTLPPAHPACRCAIAPII